MKKVRNKILCCIMAVLICATSLIVTGPETVTLKARAESYNGPDKSSKSNSSIVLYLNGSKKEIYMQTKNGKGKTSKYKGISYNKKNNTLTVKNFKNEDAHLSITCMGSDFKIKVAGNNTLCTLHASASNYKKPNGAYPCSLNLTGSGKISIGKKAAKYHSASIFLDALWTESVLSFGKNVKATIYRASDYSISVGNAVVEDCITSKGKLTKKPVIHNGYRMDGDQIGPEINAEIMQTVKNKSK